MTPAQSAAEVAKQRIAKKCGLEPSLLEDAYPCTSLQVRLLVASLNGLADYVSTFVFDVSSGPYDALTVKASFERLYSQTPVLRTRVFETRGKFLQIVTRSSISWVEHNSLSTYLEQDEQNQVNLGDDLARFAWIEEDSKTYMVWTLHHAIYDEWSISLLFQDLSLLTLQRELPRRPAFSKFVKSLSLIDRRASRAFWKRTLADIGLTRSMIQYTSHPFRTSDHLNVSCKSTLPKCNYQNSTVAIVVWSLLLSTLSGSDVISFGNVVNGRTSDIPGIVDICGPTMTTVPNIVRVPHDSSLGDFIAELETKRLEMLPFEQSGLDEHRDLVGAPNFDTLLSIRSSTNGNPTSDVESRLEPQSHGKRHVSHPCCIYLDMVFEEDACVMTASYDERYVDEILLHKALEQISYGLQHISDSVDLKIGDFVESLRLPKSLGNSKSIAREEHKTWSVQDDVNIDIDAKIFESVCRVARNVSPLKKEKTINSATSLQDLGLDSMSTVIFARRLSEHFRTNIPFKYFAGRQKTIKAVAKIIQDLLHGGAEDHMHDRQIALLDKAEEYIESLEESAKGSASYENPSAILLTGATGYVGIEILRRCLSGTNEMVILPVRCDNVDEGLSRVRRAARISKWQDSELSFLDERVRIWPSDLSAESIGLDSARIEELKTVRTIIHNGARVDFLLDYHDLETTNVSSTNFLLTTHLESSAKPSFVYVTGGRGCHLTEEDLSTTASRLATANGYAQTKFTSELLMHHAHQACKDNSREAQMSIVHPGIVMGSESTGIANTDDFVWRYVAASVQMRAYVPAVPTKREWLSLTTVDSVAAATLSAVVHHKDPSQVELHYVQTGIFVARFWEIVVDALGEEGALLEPVSERIWLSMLEKDLEERGVNNPLFSLSGLLLEGTMKGIGRRGPRSGYRESKNEDLSIERAVAANVRYLKSIGYFELDSTKSADERFERSKN